VGNFLTAPHESNPPRQNPATLDVIVANDAELGFAFGGIRVEFTHLPFHAAAGRTLLIIENDLDRFTRARLPP